MSARLWVGRLIIFRRRVLSILIAIYVIAALLLAVYGFNAWILTILYFRYRRNSPTPLATFEDSEELFPTVTIQLPIFNEALVIERLINAVVRIDYPIHLLQIQILDDSTDETTNIALACVKKYRQLGFNIKLIHRRDRVGFKAGALKYALEKATGEFITIFDADFVPNPEFLKQTIPYLRANPRLGFVQARWGHLNDDYSLLTGAQALAIDGHFTVEQTARNRAGLFINFNGTAGVWRRDCIEAVGGWQDDTICEDFDLSYRAQLAGWDCLFLPDVAVPAEIPPQLAAFKRQQSRWATGSIQCLKKLVWPVLRSSSALPVKLQALIHLSNYFAHPLLVILATITPILMLTGTTDNIRFPLIYLSLASLGPPFLFAVAQVARYPSTWKQRYKRMPILILIGGGITLSGTKAVVEALLGVGNIFRRTPKFNVVTAADPWQNSDYRLPLDWLVLGELLLAVYSLLGVWIAFASNNGFAAPFVLLYAFSYGYVGLQGLWDARLELRDWLTGGFGRRSRRAKRSRQPANQAHYLDAFEA